MTIPKSIPQNRYRLGTERPQDGIALPRHLVHAVAAGLRAQSEFLENFAYRSREVATMARRNAAQKRKDAEALEAALSADTADKAKRDEARAQANAAGQRRRTAR